MKSAAPTKRQPSKETAKPSHEATPGRRAQKAAPDQPRAARTTAPDTHSSPPMPDLTAFGVDQRTAQAHVGQCEQCGRAHRHVLKNPKDAMALQSFGRNLAACLAGKQAQASA
jgi:hypothetical protein